MAYDPQDHSDDAKRRCLGRCGKMFLSRDKGNRFCPKCARITPDRAPRPIPVDPDDIPTPGRHEDF
jgi:hypothetical protein